MSGDAITAMRARHRQQFRCVDAEPGLASIEVWRNEQWRPFRLKVDHVTAHEYIESLRRGGNDVVDGRLRK